MTAIERQRRYRARNREELNARQRARRATPKGAAKDRDRQSKRVKSPREREYRRDQERARRASAEFKKSLPQTNDRIRERKRDRQRERRAKMPKSMVGALMLLQGGMCAVCGSKLIAGRETHADHCHETGEPRGLLCHWCNTVEGKIKCIGLSPADFAARLEKYLADPPARIAKLV